MGFGHERKRKKEENKNKKKIGARFCIVFVRYFLVFGECSFVSLFFFQNVYIKMDCRRAAWFRSITIVLMTHGEGAQRTGCCI